MPILSHVYALWNWNKQIQSNNEVNFGRLKLLQKDHRALTDKLSLVTAELTEV
jgi:hypothetical protein